MLLLNEVIFWPFLLKKCSVHSCSTVGWVAKTFLTRFCGAGVNTECVGAWVGLRCCRLGLNHDVCTCWHKLMKYPLFFLVSLLSVFAVQRFYQATLVWKGFFHCLVCAFPKLLILRAFYKSVIVKELMCVSCIFKSSTLACVVHSQGCEMWHNLHSV